MTSATKTDLGSDAWAINDGVVRLREWGSDRWYDLPAGDAAEVTIGSADACSLRLHDPSGRLSRQHARLTREGPRWIVRDLESKNGVHLDGVRRPKVMLEPGAELGVGGLTLIAESPRLIALRGFLARLLGWSSARSETVDFAVRSVRLASARRTALVLSGDGDLVAIARGLHRYALGEHDPFVTCDPRRRDQEAGAIANYTSGLAALRAAAGGTMCVWPRRLPRDFAELTAALRDPGARVQLIACGAWPSAHGLASAPIEIPGLAERRGELDRIIDEYARDAAASLGIDAAFSDVDRRWVRTHSADSLPEVEKGTLRIIALRHAGTIVRASTLLGLAHASLGEWIGRRRLPPGILR